MQEFIQETFRNLMGVRCVRMEGHKQPVTELLPPLEPGAPEHRTAESHKLWNPTMAQKDKNAAIC